ncbi:unnamed protein product [Dibothriocephalus latus]|uniref:D-aminoacyl-tRNA deacylase n=1 Tax=Dibothriocephalus latus TaxID=60516 RepID=A0A3P7NP94_DIBLA|nr:unnamed protein product [Dibothriocephalus latus]
MFPPFSYSRARKVVNLRVFEDSETGKRWNKCVKDVDGEILCVSQFTLHSMLKGNKLDFHRAMAPDSSKATYENFLELVRKAYNTSKVKG